MKTPKFSKRSILIGVVALLFIAIQWAGLAMYGGVTCEKILDAEDIRFANSFIELVKKGKFQEASSQVRPEIKDQFSATSNSLQSYFKQTDGLRQQTVGCNFTSESKGGVWQKTVEVSFQWTSDTKTLLGAVKWVVENGQRSVHTAAIRPLSESLQKLNAFNLGGKGLMHWAFLSLAFVIPLFIIGTFVVLLRDKIQRRKWLWGAFILLGLWQNTLNWTTGEITSLPFSFQILGAGFARANEFSPFFVAISAPLGAVVFWIRRKYLVVQETSKS